MASQPSLVTDGGWSKEATIKHTYDALGGVAIIIQYETKKNCCIQAYVINIAISVLRHRQNVAPIPQTCLKNSSDSSQALVS